MSADLVRFVEARIAEDEAAARITDAGYYLRWGFDNLDQRVQDHLARHDPARVLRQCEAFRRIVELAEHGCGDDYERVRRALASIWSDHPEFRKEWGE